MDVFMHVSQLAGNNLHVMSGPRRQPTCWAAPWKSFPPPSSSIRPRAPCPEPAPSARLLMKMAQQMQVLHRPHLPVFFSSPRSPPALLFFSVTLTVFSHSYLHTDMCLLITWGKLHAWEKVKLILVMNTTASQWLLTDECRHTHRQDKQFWIPSSFIVLEIIIASHWFSHVQVVWLPSRQQQILKGTGIQLKVCHSRDGQKRPRSHLPCISTRT